MTIYAPRVDVPVTMGNSLPTMEYARFFRDLTTQANRADADFSPYALISSLSAYALTTDLDAYALTADLSVYALLADLSAYAKLANGNSFTGAQTVAFVTLTDAATIATDAGLSNCFAVTLGGNRTLANPTNMRDGGIYNWRIKQDGTGTRTLAYGSKFKWPGGSTPVLSTAAGAVDVIVGMYHAGDDRIEAVCTKGFA